MYSQWKSVLLDKEDHFDNTVWALLLEQYLWEFIPKITVVFFWTKILWLALSTRMYIASIERKVTERRPKVGNFNRYYDREKLTFAEKEWTKISVNSPLLCINKSTTKIFWLVSNSSCKLQIKIPIEITSSYAKLVWWYFEPYVTFLTCTSYVIYAGRLD